MAAVVDAQSVSAPGRSKARPRRVAVLYHPQVEASKVMARQLADVLAQRGAEPVLGSAWHWQAFESQVATWDWVVTLGGDGTVLRAARQTAQHGVPIVGINFGRLGFLAEVDPDEALDKVPELLESGGHVEERMMLRCVARVGGQQIGPFDALNDVFVGRGQVAHAVRLEVSVNDVPLTRFVADGLVVASPTGSTAYSLSAGGPIVAPNIDALVVTPVVPHPTPVRPLVLSPDVAVDIWLGRGKDAILTVDGQLHHTLSEGDAVRVKAAPYRARFLRLSQTDGFYRTLVERLRR